MNLLAWIRRPWRSVRGAGAPRGQWRHAVYDGGSAGSRSYSVYTPPHRSSRAVLPVVVALHGCTQTAEQFADETGFNRLADRHGFVVVYPEQSRRANGQGCWNWFDPRHQVRGSGEPALIAGITEEVLNSQTGPVLDRHRVYVLGLSAGAAMAAILGTTYPDRYAAVGIHSGVPYAAARQLPAALAAMAGAGPDPDLQGLIAYTAMGPQARVVPVTVFQGDADDTVAAASGDRVVRQWLATTRRASNGATPPPDFAHPDLVRDGRAPGGLPFSVRTWQDAHGTPLLEYWVVSGLGHAWSGGAAGGAFSDPRGPSATHAMLGFFSHHRLPATAVPVRHRWLPGLRARRGRTDGIAA